MDYQKQATDFLEKTAVKFSCEWKEYGFHFNGDKQRRHIFRCTLKRGRKRFSLTFGQSIAADSTPPTAYDILSCLQKYEVGTFENFCSEFGYDEDSRAAEETYKAVCKEYLNVCRLWSESEIEELAEIQ